MRPDLAVHAHRQSGLVTRAQAIRAGCTERELRSLTAVRGPWAVVRRGIYTTRESWDQLDERGRWALRDRAAHLSMVSMPHVMSHDSAARAIGMPLVAVGSTLVHVTRPGTLGTRTEHGVKHHRNVCGANDAGLVPGLPVTTPERTALDIGREHGFAAGVVASDWVLHEGGSRRRFAAELGAMKSWPHIVRARAAYEFADGDCESPAESLARILLTELGVGAPDPQFPVAAGGRVFWCDLRIGCHIFEVDGRTKYVPVGSGGLATRRPQDVVWDEKQRERLIAAEGLGVSRIFRSDFWGSGRAAAIQRLRSEYDVTLRRFGSSLPVHLAESARRHRTARRLRSPFDAA